VLGAVRSGPGPEVEPHVERRPARRPGVRPSDGGETPAAASPARLTALSPTTHPEGRDAAEVNGGAVPALEARRVIEHLRTADRPLTFSQLREALGGPPPARVRARLRQLVEGGDVVRGGTGRKGDPYVYGLSD
jgi:hypothetical protein